jgi:hypothetical protein
MRQIGDGMYEYIPRRRLSPEESAMARNEGLRVLRNGTPDEGGRAHARLAGIGCCVCGGAYNAPRKGDAEYVCIKCALDVVARVRVCALCGRRLTDHYVAEGLRLCHDCAEEVA